MSLIAKENAVEFEKLAEGVHIAVCYMLVDIGTHYSEMYDKHIHQVLIGWEVPSERIELERDGKKVDLPRAISKRYTLSLGTKANLRRDLDAWRGRAFSAEELEGFDLKNILGKGCQIQVMHKTSSKSNKAYASVAAIMALPKGVKVGSPENELQYFSFEDGSDIPGNIPEWIVDEITGSQEYQASHGTTEIEPQAGSPAAAAIAEDNLPF